MFYQIAHTESLWNEKQFGKDLSLPVASTTRNFRIFVIGSQGPGQWYLVAWRKWSKEGERVAWFLLTKVTYFSHITSSNTQFDQISSSEYWPRAPTSKSRHLQTIAPRLILKLKILTKPESRPWFKFITSTKHQHQNTDQTLASKSCLQPQSLDQTLCSKSERKFSFMTKRQPLNQQAFANIILSINISNSNNLNKFWVGIFTRQGHINQVY